MQFAPGQIRKDPNWKYRSAVHDQGAFENWCLPDGGHHQRNSGDVRIYDARSSAHDLQGHLARRHEARGSFQARLAPIVAVEQVFLTIFDGNEIRQRNVIISKPLNVKPRMSIDQSAALKPKSRIAVVLRFTLSTSLAFEIENPSTL
jgi:hypothetical protein